MTSGGDWRDGVERFDGERDMAFIDCPAESAEFLERLIINAAVRDHNKMNGK